MSMCNTYLKQHSQNVNYSAEINISVKNCKNWTKRNVIFRKVVSY